MIMLSAEEKWRKLWNPKCAEDYGLIVTSDEMRTFKEGRSILAMLKKEERKVARMEKLFKRIWETIQEKNERDVLEILQKQGK